MVRKQVLLSVLLAGTLAGSTSAAFAAKSPVGRRISTNPTVITGGATPQARATTQLGFGGRLILAAWTLRGIVLVDFPTIGTGNQLDGIQHRSEGVDPLGAKDHSIGGWNGPAPANSHVPAQ